MLRLALWNGRDPILKERLFGLTNSEGNHGEDVKEYYFYLDSTPTHSYMKYLYKYAQRAYTYADIILNNKKRTRNDLEYELIDTGVFDDDRYFDVVLEYAKASADDILSRVTVYNRGPQDASLRLLPTLWYRNTWSSVPGGIKPDMSSFSNSSCPTIYAAHPKLGNYYLACEGADRLLFAENETNSERIFGFSATIRKIRSRTSLLMLSVQWCEALVRARPSTIGIQHDASGRRFRG